MARARLWLKVTVSLALLAVLAAGAAVLALKAFFPEPKARAFVLEKARKQLGREVRLARIDAGLTGLHLQSLEISERPDFSAGTFLSVETFSLRPSWKALLRRKLVIASASADGLVVSVVRNADGSFNYDTLASSAAAAAPAGKPSEEEPPAELNVRHLRVARGAAAYVDKASGAAWSASGLTLRLDDFSLAEPFDLEASARVKGKAGERPIDATLAFEGTVHPARGDRAKFKVDVRRLSAAQDGLTLAAKGKISGLDAPAAEFDAALTASGQTLLDAKGDIAVSSPSAGGARAIAADLKLKTSELDTSLIAKWLPAAGIPAMTIPAGDAALEGRYEGSTAALKSFRVSWAEGRIEGSGAARGLGGSAPVYEGRAKFGLDAPEIRAGHPWIKLPPKAFIPAMRLDGEASYMGGEVKIAALEAKFKQGTASASGVVRGLGGAKLVPDLALRFAVDVPAFKVSALPAAVSFLPPDYVVPAMRLDGGARVRGDDLVFEKTVIKGKGGTLRLDGVVAKALAGTPDPALEVVADLDLPALTNKDLPFPGVPPGLELPPSRWDADLSYTPRAIRLRRFAVKIGSNDLSVTGGISDPAGRGAFDLILKCERFVLQELTRLTPRTRDLKLSGSGHFALAVVGNKERPAFSGKLRFEDIGATVAELPLSGFSGNVGLEMDKINVPNLKGKVGDGSLEMFLTIFDYTKVPKIELGAQLDRFDLGKFLAAKKKLEADAKSAQAAKVEKSGDPAEKQPSRPFRTSGDVKIGTLIHPNAQLRSVTATWDLWGVTPDMKRLNGDAQLGAGGGRIHAIGELALQSPIVKVLLYPLLIVQKIRFGVDLNNIAVVGIIGDYLFKDGVMTLRRSELDAGEAALVSTVGTIDLPAEILDLTVSARVGNLPGADVEVKGTFTKPETKIKYGKILKNAGENLGETGKKLLESILKPR